MKLAKLLRISFDKNGKSSLGTSLVAIVLGVPIGSFTGNVISNALGGGFLGSTIGAAAGGAIGGGIAGWIQWILGPRELLLWVATEALGVAARVAMMGMVAGAAAGALEGSGSAGGWGVGMAIVVSWRYGRSGPGEHSLEQS